MTTYRIELSGFPWDVEVEAETPEEALAVVAVVAALEGVEE